MILGLVLVGVTPALANTGADDATAEHGVVTEDELATTAPPEGVAEENVEEPASEVEVEAEVATPEGTTDSGLEGTAATDSDEDVADIADISDAVAEDALKFAPELLAEAGAPASGNGTISGKILDPKNLIRPGEKLVVAAFAGRKFAESTLLNFDDEINGATSFTIDKLPRINNITLIVAPAHQDLSRLSELGWTSAPGSTGTYDRSKLGYVDLSSKKDRADITFTVKPGFADMYMSLDCCNKFYKEIMWMHDTGLSTGVRFISSGDGDTTQHYRPKDTVTREAMAAFLYRLNTPKGAKGPAGYTVPGTTPFADVPTNHKFYKEIAWMRWSGLSTGIKSGGTVVYAPKSGVSREAMAAFMFRMEKPNYKVSGTQHFKDVPRGHKFFTQIQWMYDSKLSTGVKQSNGKPVYLDQARVSREAMAAFLYRSEH